MHTVAIAAIVKVQDVESNSYIITVVYNATPLLPYLMLFETATMECETSDIKVCATTHVSFQRPLQVDIFASTTVV